MKISNKGLYAIAIREGLVPGPYLDTVGVWTYGLGHTAAAGAPNPAHLQRGMPANLEAAIQDAVDLLMRDIQKYEARVNRAIKVPILQYEYDAMVSFDYNSGRIHNAFFVNGLNAGNRTLAAKQIMNFSKPPEVIPRREEEQRMFRDGVYPTGPIPIWAVDKAGKVDRRRPMGTMGLDEFVARATAAAPKVEAETESPARPGWLRRAWEWILGKL